MRLCRYAALILFGALPFLLLALVFAAFIGVVALVQGNVASEFLVAALIIVIACPIYLFGIAPVAIRLLHKVKVLSVVFTKDTVAFRKQTFPLNQVTITYERFRFIDLLLQSPTGRMTLKEHNSQNEDFFLEVGYFTANDIKRLQERGIPIKIV